MLFRCNYVALVVTPLMNPFEAVGASQSPVNKSHRVVIWDDLKQRGVIELEFSSEVKAVKLRRERIIVVLTQMIKVFTFNHVPSQLHVFDTTPNPRGLCTLSPTSDNWLMAFPVTMESTNTVVSSPTSSRDKCTGVGRVQIVDLANIEKQPITIVAHDTK